MNKKHFISFLLLSFFTPLFHHTPIEESLFMGNSGTTGGYGYVPKCSGESEAMAMRLLVGAAIPFVTLIPCQ